MDIHQAGKYIFIAGAVIAVMGLALWLYGNKLSWFGNLPGDIKVERENFRICIPVVSMLLLSVALSAIVWLVKNFF